jgi:V8-like Glu-specific endopeptidase
MTEQEYVAIKRAAQNALLKIPGVHAVGLGGKRVNGRNTGEVAILVFVTEKKPPDEIPPDELIPAEIDGVKTDVIEAPQFSPHADTKEYRPLKGGAQIQVPGGGSTYYNGTLGCMAQTVPSDGTDKSGKTVLLTNYHVLESIKEGEKVYQPYAESHCSDCCPTAVAKKLDAVLSDDVDGATAEIVSDVKIKPTIIDLGDVTGTYTVTVEDATSGTYLVKKRGRTTKVTQGTVYSIYLSGTRTDGWEYQDQIGVEAAAPSTTVSQPGDSGSVFINDSNQVIGLLWGGDGETQSVASPIQAVMDQLGIVISVADSAAEIAEEEAATDRQTLTAAVLSDLQQSEQGRRYVEYYFRHHAEIRALVNTNRRVATAWHRNYGPEIFRSVIRLAQERESTLPEEIEGRPLALCLDGILGAFLKYGSPVLKKDIIMESPDASGLGGLSYEQLLERLGTSSRE